MLSLKDVEIVRFVAHLVDPQTGGLKLSNAETPVGPGSAFPHAFFKRHILHALGAEGRRLAAYQSPGSGTVESAFALFRNGGLDFVQASERIARHLEDRIAKSPYRENIEPGDLMVAHFREAAAAGDGGSPGESARDFLAILKIKPSDAVIRRQETKGGKTWVEFETDERIPSAREGGERKLQKVALLSERREAEPEPFDLVVLDYQLNRKGVAQFFYRDFLESELSRDPSETTQQLIDELARVIRQSEKLVTPPLSPPEKLAVLAGGLRVLASRDRVSPRAVAEEALALPGRPAEQRAALQQQVLARLEAPSRPDRKVLPEEEVPIVNGLARRRGEKRSYRLDDGVVLTGDAQALDQMVAIAGPDAQDRYTLTIRTRVFNLG
jgi:hypothetical protein